MVYVPFQGFIRFSKEGAAQRVVETLKAKNDGKVVIRDVETTLRVLEGMYVLQLFSRQTPFTFTGPPERALPMGCTGTSFELRQIVFSHSSPCTRPIPPKSTFHISSIKA